MGSQAEVFNSTRHEHTLRYTEDLGAYKCSGCKGQGANEGYECPSCPEFVLHEICAASPDEVRDHPFFRSKQLKFRHTTHLRHDCDACGVLIRGFLFESSEGCKFHPLCLKSPLEFKHSGHPDHKLGLITNQERRKYSCRWCRKENKKWNYQCETVPCEVKMDMNCAMLDFLRLSQHGITQVYKPSRTKRVLKKVAKAGKYIGTTVASTVATVLVGEASDTLADRGTVYHDEGGSDHGGEGRNGR